MSELMSQLELVLSSRVMWHQGRGLSSEDKLWGVNIQWGGCVIEAYIQSRNHLGGYPWSRGSTVPMA